MDTANPGPRKLGWRRVLLLVAVVCVALFVGVWFGLTPRSLRTPLRWLRDPGGAMRAEDEENPTRGGLQASLESLQANSRFVSGTVSGTSGDQPRFDARRWAIYCDSTHPLMERVGPLVAERLAQLPSTDSVDYFPSGQQEQPGKLAPDVIVRIELGKCEESGLLNKSVEATIVVNAGTSWAHSRHSYFDHLSPPVVQFDYRGQLDHSSTRRGVASAGAKYKRVAEDIAANIGEQLKKVVAEFTGKYKPLPELPGEFYPGYRPADSWPWLAALRPTQLISNHGLMNHNETVWQFTSDKEAPPLLAEIQTAMESLGWKGSANSGDQIVRMTQGPREFWVFATTARGVSTQQSDATGQYYVRYVDRMSDAEMRDAVSVAFAQQASPDTLLMFRSFFERDQYAELLARLTAQPSNCERQLAAAEILQQLKRNDEAQAMLARAAALQLTMPDSGRWTARIESLAKKLGCEPPNKQPPSDELLRELGVIELSATAPLDEVILSEDRPACFFGHSADGKLEVFSVRLESTPGERANGTYQVSLVKSAPGMQSVSRTTMQRSAQMGQQLDGVCQLMFHLAESDQPGEFMLLPKVLPLPTVAGPTAATNVVTPAVP